MARYRGTLASDVLMIVEHLEPQGVVHQINGGWAVDALWGQQTRDHADVDVFLDTRALAATISWLEEQGFVAAVDDLPSRIELHRGRTAFDLHPMIIDPHGNGRQICADGSEFSHLASRRTTGTIGGRQVVVADRERLIELREGYPPRSRDLHDLEILRRTDGSTQP